MVNIHKIACVGLHIAENILCTEFMKLSIFSLVLQGSVDFRGCTGFCNL